MLKYWRARRRRKWRDRSAEIPSDRTVGVIVPHEHHKNCHAADIVKFRSTLGRIYGQQAAFMSALRWKWFAANHSVGGRSPTFSSKFTRILARVFARTEFQDFRFEILDSNAFGWADATTKPSTEKLSPSVC